MVWFSLRYPVSLITLTNGILLGDWHSVRNLPGVVGAGPHVKGPTVSTQLCTNKGAKTELIFFKISGTMTDRKAVIKNADMSEDMQQDAVDCATQAMEKYNIEKDIAAYIKKVRSNLVILDA